jgi:choline dehydrogenase
VQEADYIIIGAGSAGCVLAARLSEDENNQVLILEAGGKDKSLFVHMPAGYSQLVSEPNDYNYGFETEPDENLGGRRLYWPRGRGLGGSSSINAMVYVRGHSWDYDHWNQLGNKGWSYSNVLPYFKRAESFDGDGDEGYHGKSGPLHVKKSNRTDDKLLDVYVEAGIQAGFPFTNDFNGRQQEGVARYEHTLKGARRASAAQCYLHPSLHRDNLEAMTDVTVDRIIFEGRKAVGVIIQKDGKEITLKARREVILSAGALNSPQILMRSGVGDPADIKPHGIDMVHELTGVGKNLQDHYGVCSQFQSTQNITLHRSAVWWKTALAGLQFLLFKTGDASFPPTAGGGFIRSSPEKEIPDTQIHYVSVAMIDSHGREGITPEHGFTNVIYSCRPLSRGHLTLAGAGADLAPAIHPNYLSHPQDIVDIRNGFRQARSIFMQKAFDPYRGQENKPGPDVNIDDDDQLDQWIRDTGETLYHPVGTCKMGTDDLAVTNEHGEVHGIEGLRVIDASIMPTLIGGNTNAPTIMIAEKISDHIRGNRFLPSEHPDEARA